MRSSSSFSELVVLLFVDLKINESAFVSWEIILYATRGLFLEVLFVSVRNKEYLELKSGCADLTSPSNPKK